MKASISVSFPACFCLYVGVQLIVKIRGLKIDDKKNRFMKTPWIDINSWESFRDAATGRIVTEVQNLQGDGSPLLYYQHVSTSANICHLAKSHEASPDISFNAKTCVNLASFCRICRCRQIRQLCGAVLDILFEFSPTLRRIFDRFAILVVACISRHESENNCRFPHCTFA